MKKIFTLLVIAVFLVSCTSSTPNRTSQVFQPQNIVPTLILQSNLYGAGQENILEQRTVIDNAADFNILINKMNIVNNTMFPPISTSVDFNTHKVIAVFDQIRGNGGHSIDITNVVENQNNVTVTVQRLLTGGLTTVVTQPFHIVKIPTTNKPIIFN